MVRQCSAVTLSSVSSVRSIPSNSLKAVGGGSNGKSVTDLPMRQVYYWKVNRIIFEAHRQLLELHGLPESEVPAPYAAACMSWNRDPFGGGAHFWNMGVRSHEVAEQILQPIERCPIYLCGEAWSHDQGWVEGALATFPTSSFRSTARS